MSNDRAAMRIGTDGVLLGAWCDVSGARRVLDVGTGTGVIALMIAQRSPEAKVDAIDIDRVACGEAEDNFGASAWSARLSVECCSLAQYDADPYDLIVCNPPYYNGYRVEDESRRAARHADSLPLDVLVSTSCRLLTPSGTLAMVLPRDNDAEVRRLALLNGLHVARHTAVLPVVSRPPKRSLWQLGREQVVEIADELVLHSDRYKRLVHDFYLYE